MVGCYCTVVDGRKFICEECADILRKERDELYVVLEETKNEIEELKKQLIYDSGVWNISDE